MQVTMTVTKDENDRDVFRLGTSPSVDVDIKDSNGTEQLKKMFSSLLEELSKDDVEVVFNKTADYKVAMYEDVCREYVDVLNQELKQARQRLIDEGLCS
ncbi:hypothetical protein [Gordonibacter sp. Marseille-P4307]|uniref:hypothetical protein n=1 Tax=Gordonibacter sp. Marseille-P4307 TaxID=2161815 RepID=UPI000F53D49C|nr:hypothetical protein [Gordonibacter sp. Marseille-P4307]